MTAPAPLRLALNMKVRVIDPTTRQPYPDGHRYGGVCTVRKINPKNLILELPGTTRDLSCPKTMVTDDLTAPDPAAAARSASVLIPLAPPIGTVVRIDATRIKLAPGMTPEDLWVVTKDIPQSGKVSIFRLNGDGVRYWNISTAAIIRMEITSIEVQPAS